MGMAKKSMVMTEREHEIPAYAGMTRGGGNDKRNMGIAKRTRE
jgi:hypothetical protein